MADGSDPGRLITVEDVFAAADRIHPHIRRTPLIRVDQLSEPLVDGELRLKLECLQVTGSFKARGATNRLLASTPEALANGVVTASGGNHGIAVARAGRLAGVPTTVFLPANAAPDKIAKLKRWGARVEMAGRFFDESDQAARAFAASKGAAYFHPFADAPVVAGQGTLALEIMEEFPEADVYLVAIGGGGLVAGMATAIRDRNPRARIIGIEPTGCPTIRASLDAGHVVRLDEITTIVPTMSCARTDDRVFDVIQSLIDDVVLVEDEMMVEAAEWLWFELGIAADLSGAAGIAALKHRRVQLTGGERVCALVCGAGVDGLGK